METPIAEKIKNIPASPGVYIMKGREGEVIYIGKAKSLQARVRTYFRASGDTRYAARFLASRVRDIDYIVTGNEKEALLLEDTLVKQHRPRYNIQLKDSKTYVSIKMTMPEKFPRILLTRQIKKDGSRYFGPYVSAREVRETVKFLRRIFPLCVCSASVFRNRVRPCLDYQLGICSAPAVGLISEEAYAELVRGAVMFLEGRNTELLRELKKKMEEAAKNLDFEEAGRIRDRVLSIESMLEGQRVVAHDLSDRDVFTVARDENTVVVQVLCVRGGRLVKSADYAFPETGLPDEEILSSFLPQFYRAGSHVPGEIIISACLEDAPLIEEILLERAGRRVTILTPVRGEKKRLVKMAGENALESLRKRAQVTDKEKAGAVLTAGLQRRLRLKTLPTRVEAFDISNIGADIAVGAMVSFKDGEPDKNNYRLFKIRGVAGPDDYAMIKEVMGRRYSKAGTGLPDLILIDGGKGQLNIALSVLEELGIKGVEVAALAKEGREGGAGGAGGAGGEAMRGRRGFPGKPSLGVKGERVFLPNIKDAILLKEGSGPDLLLRRIRDEVHRFAISYSRRLKSKAGSLSVLDTIPGIGDKKKKALFEKFPDIEAIRNATIEELTKVPGITERLALAIKEGLREKAL